MDKVQDIRDIFISKYKSGDIIRDNLRDSGQVSSTIEIINASFVADEDYIFKKPSQKYIDREIAWYESQSLNVYDIPGYIPETWRNICDKDGFINSNYGWCIWSKENGNQYRNCLRQLISDPNGRRACMIYTRPSMQTEWDKNGMKDFMCTFSTQQLIRGGKLHYMVFMRSCDIVYGYRNDRAWAYYVAKKLIKDLQANKVEVEDEPMIYWNAGSLHIYSSAFCEIEKYIEEHEDSNL